jgi:hypothetical protein
MVFVNQHFEPCKCANSRVCCGFWRNKVRASLLVSWRFAPDKEGRRINKLLYFSDRLRDAASAMRAAAVAPGRPSGRFCTRALSHQVAALSICITHLLATCCLLRAFEKTKADVH